MDLETSLGPARLTVALASRPVAALWLGHGAGGGIEARDLAALAKTLPARGVTVLRHEQPWRVAGRRIAVRPPLLDIGWLESLPAVRELIGGLPLVVGGRSAGARVACRTAGQVGAVGVVCLGFPLHPPSRPEKSRLEELLLPEVPVLVVQGERDSFGPAATVAAETARTAGQNSIRVVPVPEADHGLRVAARSGVDAARIVTSTVADFLDELVRPKG